MKLATVFQEIRRRQRYATVDDIRKIFGDYHNVLYWLAAFLVGDETVAKACIIDACNIAQSQPPVFHEWLVHWAARATVRCALLSQQEVITQLAPRYAVAAPAQVECPPLSAEDFQVLVRNSEHIRDNLDVLCRFVLVNRGVAKDSIDEVALQLGISRGAAERAYFAAYTTVKLAACGDRHSARGSHPG